MCFLSTSDSLGLQLNFNFLSDFWYLLHGFFLFEVLSRASFFLGPGPLEPSAGFPSCSKANITSCRVSFLLDPDAVGIFRGWNSILQLARAAQHLSRAALLQRSCHTNKNEQLKKKMAGNFFLVC
jgi:hypothetical protein